MPATETPPTKAVFRLVDGKPLLEDGWPATLLIADDLIQVCGWMTFRWPFLVIRVTDGHAIYQVESLDQGIWTGTLLECLIPR